MVAQSRPESILNCWPDADRALLRFSAAGSGPPLVFLHGLLGGSFCWRFNVPEFAAARMTCAIDMSGMGTCDVAGTTDCSMRAQAQRLCALIERNHWKDIDLVGSSWGGGVAILLAAQTSRIRSLVLVAPVNPWSDFGRGRVRFFAGPIGGILLRCGLPFSRRLHDIGVQRMYGDISRIRPGTMEGYYALLVRPGRARNLINILRSWDADLEALGKAIPRTKVPALLIWGTRDGAVDPESARALAAALPQARTVMLDGLGHLPFEESPEVFNRLVLDFIARPR